MTIRKGLIGLTLALLSGLMYFAWLHPSPVVASSLPWDSVRQAYQRARDLGQTAAVDEALALADGYLQAHPQDGLALTYRGSLATLRARISWMPWKKLGWLHEGISQMDDGVALAARTAPASSQALEARLVRGLTSANIPQTFGRGGIAFADLQAVASNPQFAQWEPHHRATVLAWLSVLHRRQGGTADSDRLRRQAEAIDAAAARRVLEPEQ